MSNNGFFPGQANKTSYQKYFGPTIHYNELNKNLAFGPSNTILKNPVGKGGTIPSFVPGNFGFIGNPGLPLNNLGTVNRTDSAGAGGLYTFTVPVGCTAIAVYLRGSSYTNTCCGFFGAFSTTFVMPVTPGQQFSIRLDGYNGQGTTTFNSSNLIVTIQSAVNGGQPTPQYSAAGSYAIGPGSKTYNTVADSDGYYRTLPKFLNFQGIQTGWNGGASASYTVQYLS